MRRNLPVLAKKSSAGIWTRIEVCPCVTSEVAMNFGVGSDTTVETRRSRNNVTWTDHNKTTVLATLLPDEILKHSHALGKERWTFECILLLGDVSGFTALTEKYTLTGKGGTYRMTKTLNAYIGKMVEAIINYSGDVLKFSGDAFLCCWKVDSNETMGHAVNQVVRCALFIQETMGEYETDVKVSLRVKLAVSAGTGTFAVIGTEESRQYMLVGEPIAEVRMAEHMCVSGDIVLAPSAWKFCNPEQYMYTLKGDLGYIKIIHTARISSKTLERDEVNQKPDPAPKPPPELIRLTIVNAAVNQDGPYLRPFIIAPVLKQVDHEQPLEYLTEMRQVVTMFVNVLTSPVSLDQYITLVDNAYCIICKFSDESSGCVNKASLFDKDLMFVVLFGLRGFKHDMGIKNALWCATNVRKSVSCIEGVGTVSVGVSTGVTYCGVVGHPLRREYTVIGSPVNKAARLMVAYPGKITCERNTFLHSKLPATYFHLQEAKELKGLTSVGPIYEFLEEEDKKRETSIGPKFPILGREKVISVFLSKLAALRGEQRRVVKSREEDLAEITRTQHAGIVFHGEPRIGKTRLLEELCEQSKNRGLPCKIVPLTSAHRRSPFAAVAYIFQLLIGINEFSTLKEKEEILMSHFGEQLSSDELCYLNDIFQVKFLMSDAYIAENAHEKMAKRRVVAQKIMTLFCSSAAPVYVIGVDDIHHIDPPSAVLLSSFLDCDGLMFIVTVTGDIIVDTTRQGSVGSEGIDFLSVGDTQAALNHFYQHPCLLCYPLPGLPLRFMAPLACQILDVRGIPLELETVLQNESQGNPGWVESYLLSLMQTGALLLTTLNEKDPYFENLIFPTEKLVTQQNVKDLSGLKLNDNDVDDPKQFADVEVMIADKDRDDFSYQHHMQMTMDISDARMMALVANQRVCILAPNYNFEDSSIPKTMYGVVMTAFDSLDPFSQLLVKVASVLGNTCMRVLLVSVMKYPGTKKVAEAVRDSFDARILCCGTPVTKERIRSVMYHNLLGQHGVDSYQIDCHCHEGYRLNVGVDLPKYAFCSLLKFRTPLYRDTAYGLLTDDQKKDFHGRAVKFLEGEAHKCDVCGGGPFFKVPSLNAPLSEWLSAYENDSLMPEDSSLNTSGKLKSTYVERVVLTKHKKHHEVPIVEINRLMSSAAQNKTESADQALEDASMKSMNYFDVGETLFKCFGCGSESKESGVFQRCESNVSMGVCLSKVDLHHCECHLTLSSVYIHLIEHARAAGMKKKLIPLLIEFGAAAVPLGISTQAAKLLGEADNLLQELLEEGEKCESSWFALGKIRTLQGQALWDLGQHQHALTLLLSALKSYGHPLPSDRFRTSLVLAKEALHQWLIQHIPFLFSQHSYGSRALSSAMAECLSLIFKISVVENNWHLAELAAVKGLNEARRTKRNFIALCSAYCDGMELSMQDGNLKWCQYLESMALKLCHQISGRITNDRGQLQVLARLYYVTFNSRLLRGELDAAIRIGFRTIRLSNKMQESASTKLQILPLLVQSLMLCCRLHETVDMLQELARTAEEESDTSGTTWYYALCLDLMLNTGLTLEKYVTCKAYADERMDSMGIASVRDPNADRCLLLSLWLWCVRCERWEEALAMEDQKGFSVGINSVTAAVASLGLNEDASSKSNHLSSFPNLFTALKYLEGLQLTLVGKLDTRSYSAIPDIHHSIIHVTATLKKLAHQAPVVKPRLIHLCAHFSMIKALTANAMWLLLEAASLSEKQGNLLEDAWIDHNKKVWLHLVTGFEKDFWRDHCQEEPVDWHEGEQIHWSSIMFSLPVPRNFL